MLKLIVWHVDSLQYAYNQFTSNINRISCVSYQIEYNFIYFRDKNVLRFYKRLMLRPFKAPYNKET